MCCTGGVRCEKSTAFMKVLGFENVFHLQGGIVTQLEETKASNGYWMGECFVFDSRLAIDKNLDPIKDKHLWIQNGKHMKKIDQET